MVNVCQLYSLVKIYSEDVDIYIRSAPYYWHYWTPMPLSSLLPGNYVDRIKDLKPWQGERVDAVYRIAYPTQLNSSSEEILQSVPTFVFFVSNGIIEPFHFSGCGNDDNSSCVSGMLNDPANRKVQLVVPSPTSFRIVKSFLHEVDLSNRLSLVTHGVDLEMFQRIEMPASLRTSIRKQLNLLPDDIVFLNVGAMVPIKGTGIMLLTLIRLSRHPEFSRVKFLFKGLDDFYDSEARLDVMIDNVLETDFTTREEVDRVIEKHVRFFGDTVSLNYLNVIYNIADAYLSPYIVEGFNLPVLEAIAVGLPVFVSENGSTSFYVNEILRQVPGADQHIFLLDARSYTWFGVDYVIDFSYTYNSVVSHFDLLTVPCHKYYYHAVRSYIEGTFTWDVAAQQLMRLFRKGHSS